MKLSSVFALIAVLALVILLVGWGLVTFGVALPYALAPILFCIEAVFGVAAFLLWTNYK